MTLTDCPVRTTIDVVEGKWKPLILFAMKRGTQRYAQLRAQLREPSEKVLVEQLRQLENDGILERTSYPDVPPRVDYRLTPYGYTLMPLLQQMADWGAAHRERNQAGSPAGLKSKESAGGAP